MGTPSPPLKRRWPNLLPLFVGLVVVAEIAFLGRLDMAKNAAMVSHWTTTFQFPATTARFSNHNTSSFPNHGAFKEDGGDDSYGQCEDWLEREDSIPYARNFTIDPIMVYSASTEDWSMCSVCCVFGPVEDRAPDATFSARKQPATATILRSMESSKYYTLNNIAVARRRGFDVLMTTSLLSDVPVGYFSWAEYDIMAPLYPKTRKALAAAFISNCAARNFRIEALKMLENLGIEIDSYGICHRNRYGNVDKLEALKHYKFSLAFENSNEDDYITEKFFQSLVAGAIPVVVGAPNIQDFAPSHGSILHIKELSDVESVAKTMKFLAANPDAYNKSLSWKYDGPSDSFKALLDMAAVHSSCRLCIFLATKNREKEEMAPEFQNRPCKCTTSSATVYHLYVRERGRFHMESIFLRSVTLTLNALESAILSKFRSLNHTPVWMTQRPQSLRGGDLKIYRIYPLGLTQRQALYSFKFNTDDELRRHIESHPCAKLEVIFV